MNWAAMTYDQQRALLGLPDVRLRIALDHLNWITRALTGWANRNTGRPYDYALAGGKDA